jgi:hypothetical protein
LDQRDGQSARGEHGVIGPPRRLPPESGALTIDPILSESINALAGRPSFHADLDGAVVECAGELSD